MQRFIWMSSLLEDCKGILKRIKEVHTCSSPPVLVYPFSPWIVFQIVSLGKLLLANLFAGKPYHPFAPTLKSELTRVPLFFQSGFIEAEVAQRSSRLDPSEGARRAPPAHIRMMGSQPNTPGGILASSSLATPGMTAALAPTDDASGPSPRKDYFSKQVMSSNHLAVPSTPGGGSTTGPDTPFSPGVTVQTPGGSFMGKFKGFGKGKKPPVGMTLNLPANPLLEEDVRQKVCFELFPFFFFLLVQRRSNMMLLFVRMDS